MIQCSQCDAGQGKTPARVAHAVSQRPPSRVTAGRLLAAVFAAVLLAGCGFPGRQMIVEVVVYNYSPNPISSVRVQGQPVLGHFQKYGPGGTGGSIYCCIEVRPGRAEVGWELGRPPGTPEPPEGWFRAVTGDVPKPAPGDKFLGVHVYAEDAVELTLTPDIRREKPQGVAYD